MSGVDLSPVEAGPIAKSPAWSRLRRRLGPSAWPPLAAIGGLGLMALLARSSPVADLTDVDLTSTFAPPSAGHPLGTDSNGRDILARLVWGSRTALLGPLIVTVVATTLGVPLAVAAAWRGGWFDSVISRVFDLLFGFPGILLALVVAAVVGAGFGAAVAALSVAFIPYIGRVTRGGARQQLRLPYVAALRCWASPRRDLRPSPPAEPGRHHRRPGHRHLRLRAGRPGRPVLPRPGRRPGHAGLGRAGRRRSGRHPRRLPGAVRCTPVS